MDPGVKVAAALSVLVTAICLALLFWSDPGSLNSPARGPLKLRADSEPAPTLLQPLRRPDPFASPLDPGPQAAYRPPTILAPSGTASEPPPCRADERPAGASRPPAANAEEQTSWGTAAGVKMPELHVPRPGEEESAPRTHTIIDGDTLPDLARRYLGAADRYLEIYQWNSDVLAHPEVLPIGHLLRIPPRAAARPKPVPPIERPLVPIPQP